MTDSDLEEVQITAIEVGVPAKRRKHKEYEVVAVLDHRVVDGMTQYLVHWLGYPASKATWEDASHLINAKETVVDYWKGREGNSGEGISSNNSPVAMSAALASGANAPPEVRRKWNKCCYSAVVWISAECIYVLTDCPL